MYRDAKNNYDDCIKSLGEQGYKQVARIDGFEVFTVMSSLMPDLLMIEVIGRNKESKHQNIWVKTRRKQS